MFKGTKCGSKYTFDTFETFIMFEDATILNTVNMYNIVVRIFFYYLAYFRTCLTCLRLNILLLEIDR